MKYISPLALAITAASALFLQDRPRLDSAQQETIAQELFLVELSPGETRWISEDEKWELKRKGLNFMDITATQHTYPHVLLTERAMVKYPSQPTHNDSVTPLLKVLSKDSMRQNLEKFTTFHTRYYKSHYGVESAEWLYGKVKDTFAITEAQKHGATVSKFKHSWAQFSIIAQIPGKTNKTVVFGAHQDSINMFLPALLAAPGADDDGSGTVAILEALGALLKSEDVVKGNAENTIEFHWYSAEEGGLLGSQAIFSEYAKQGKDIKAMIQLDEAGFVKRTLAAGLQESFGLITDFVDPALTEFMKEIIKTYCDIPYTLTKCGYACSDHASASKYGFPSAFVTESEFKYSNPKTHSTEDKIEYLSFDHILQHAKMTLGAAYELAFASL